MLNLTQTFQLYTKEKAYRLFLHRLYTLQFNEGVRFTSSTTRGAHVGASGIWPVQRFGGKPGHSESWSAPGIINIYVAFVRFPCYTNPPVYGKRDGKRESRRPSVKTGYVSVGCGKTDELSRHNYVVSPQSIVTCTSEHPASRARSYCTLSPGLRFSTLNYAKSQGARRCIFIKHAEDMWLKYCFYLSKLSERKYSRLTLLSQRSKGRIFFFWS